MSGDDSIGYGRPPKACQFPKGRSGNPRGRKRRPPATLAETIEKHFMEPMVVGEGDDQKKVIPFEVIVANLIAKIGDASKKA